MITAKNSKRLGGVLLVVGTTIGGAILALPTTGAAAGFWWSTGGLLLSWLLMGLGALALLELSILMPAGSNLMSMAQKTLGPWGMALTWGCYFLLPYALVAAYITSGSDLVKPLIAHWSYANLWSPLIFTVILGTVVAAGISAVDRCNRWLVVLKFVAYGALMVWIVPHASREHLVPGPVRSLLPALPVMISSFGFATLIPTLREYFADDVKSLRGVILLGSFIPFVLYVLWDFAVLSTVPRETLLDLLHQSSPSTAVADALAKTFGNPQLSAVARLFTSICVTTSFLSVGIGLSDFISDAFGWKKQGTPKLWTLLTAFIPPLLLVMVYPKAFIVALNYAGTLCLILCMLLPLMMLWSARYRLGWKSAEPLWGGKPLLLLTGLVTVWLLVISIAVDLGVLHL